MSSTLLSTRRAVGRTRPPDPKSVFVTGFWYWRRASAPLRPLPDFVIVGAQRSGTTSLATWLWSHPQVRRARASEVRYFDDHYDRGINWYRSQFPLWRPNCATGESTPLMMFNPLTPARVAHDLPRRTKFIAVLREPVERAISAYWLMRKMGRERLSLVEAIDAEPERLAGEAEKFATTGLGIHHRRHSYVSRGEYASQLRRWFDHVGRERFYVIGSDELFGDPGARNSLLDWLGFPPSPEPLPAKNSAPRTEETDPALIARLREHFAPHNEELFELLGRRLWSPLPTDPREAARG